MHGALESHPWNTTTIEKLARNRVVINRLKKFVANNDASDKLPTLAEVIDNELQHTQVHATMSEAEDDVIGDGDSSSDGSALESSSDESDEDDDNGHFFIIMIYHVGLAKTSNS